MKIPVIALSLIFWYGNLLAQNFEKIEFNEDIEEGYYLAVPPESAEIAGVLVLLPGFAQKAESIFPETKIHNVAYVNGILTIAIAGGHKLYADEKVTAKLDEAFNYIKKKFSVDKENFVIGGFSAGGTISLRYAEYCYENPERASVQPQAVFSVDSPVDLFHIWDYFNREIEKNFSEAGVSEAKYVAEIMLKEIGDPQTNKANYERLTPFNSELTNPGNEKYLKNIGVRVYHDVDIAWQLKKRRRSLFDSNALASSEMINRLLLLNNERAEFKTAKKPGYRSSGVRHPHSWSIVDEVELIQWVKNCLK